MGPGPAEQTFLFADLAGFTALTEVHGDEEAADLAAVFCDEVRAALPPGSEIVKTIGDAVMVRARAPSAAAALGLRIVRETGARHGFASVRVGMHYGPAVERAGDWFGTTVNVAARVASIASGGEVLATAAVAAAAAHPEVRFEDHGERRLRNIAEPVRLVRVLPAGGDPAPFEIDPVCRMTVHPERAAGSLTAGGRVYWFCTLDCAARFAADPGLYVGHAAG